MVRLALLSLACLLVLSTPAAARSAPPQCQDDELLTPVGEPLDLPPPTCRGVTQQTALELVPGSGPAHGAIHAGVYVPAAGYHGFDSFRYTLTDAVNGKSNEFTISVLVDTPPECRDTAATVTAGRSLVLPDLGCTDKDGDPLTIYYDDPANGTLAVRGDDLVYTPDPGYVGLDTFTYYAEEDDYPVASDDAWMQLTVLSPPVIAFPPRTPAPTPVPSAPPADLSSPLVTLKDASRRQRLAISLTRNENVTAKLTATLNRATARKLKLSRTVGAVNVALTPGRSNVSLKLTAKARKAFKKLERVELKLTAVVTDSAGNTTIKTLTVTLKR